MLETALIALDVPLQITPHLMRHSVASNDKFFEKRSLEEIRRRGFWASPKSVAIYERHAALLRTVEKLSPDQQRHCKFLEGKLKSEISLAVQTQSPVL